MIHIISESSTAAGIRRIEAITAARTEMYMDSLLDTLSMIRTSLNNAPDVMAAIRRTVEENAELKKQAEAFAKAQLQELKKRLLENVQMINGVSVMPLKITLAPDVVKNLAFQLRGEKTDHFLFVAGTTDVSGKPLLTVALSDDLVAAGLSASALVRNAAKHIQGGGGGQPHFAQAGGKNPEGLSVAVDEIIAAVTSKRHTSILYRRFAFRCGALFFCPVSGVCGRAKREAPQGDSLRRFLSVEVNVYA